MKLIKASDAHKVSSLTRGGKFNVDEVMDICMIRINRNMNIKGIFDAVINIGSYDVEEYDFDNGINEVLDRLGRLGYETTYHTVPHTFMDKLKRRSQYEKDVKITIRWHSPRN